MAEVSDPLELGRWITSTAAAIGLKAHRAIIPRGADFPAIRWQILNGTDVSVVNGFVVLARYTVLITVVADMAETSASALSELGEQLNDAFHKSVGSTDEIVILSCRRLEPYLLDEIVEGDHRMTHVGGIFRIDARQAA